MNAAIDVNTFGRWSRSSPRRKSGTGVVAARTTLAATPERALDQDVPHRPQALDRQRETEHLDPCALADERQEQRERDERHLDHQPLGDERDAARSASWASTDEHHRVDAERPERLPRRRDDGEHEQDAGPRACTPARAGGRLSPVDVERVGVAAAHGAGAGRGGRSPRRRARRCDALAATDDREEQQADART